MHTLDLELFVQVLEEPLKREGKYKDEYKVLSNHILFQQSKYNMFSTFSQIKDQSCNILVFKNKLQNKKPNSFRNTITHSIVS